MSGRGSWFREKDGDLNPGWFLVAMFAIIGLILVGIDAYNTVIGSSRSVPSFAYAFVLSVMLACAIMVVPIARAKLLARGLGSAAGNLAASGGSQPVGLAILGMDNRYEDDER